MRSKYGKMTLISIFVQKVHKRDKIYQIRPQFLFLALLDTLKSEN